MGEQARQFVPAAHVAIECVLAGNALYFAVGRHPPLVDSLRHAEHDGRVFLRGGAGGGAGPIRQPEIFNTDQGSQFTDAAFTGVLVEAGVRVSMGGRGRSHGQRVHRTRLALAQTLGRLSERLCRWPRGEQSASANASPSTTSALFIRRSAIARRWPSGAKARRRQADQKSAADRTLGGLIKDNQQRVRSKVVQSGGTAS